MCLPIGCLKTIVCLSTVLTLALGVISIVCSVTIGTNDLFISSVKETKLVVMYLLLVFGIILVLLSLTGIVGVCKKSSCCLAIYNIGIFIFFIVFMAVGIGALALFKHYKVDDIDNYHACANTSWLEDANNYAIKAQDYLCHDPCPCNLNITSPIPIDYNISVNGSSKLQDCQGFKKNFSSFDDYFTAMELIEREFNCAGVCGLSPYYLFTDVNRGEPRKACAPKIQDYLDTYSKRIGAVSIVVAVILLLVIVMSCCLCCHPEKRSEPNIYRRLA